MKSSSTYPTLGQMVTWTAIFYACFGILLSILGWILNTASDNILLGMLGLDTPLWATGWLFLLFCVPTFALVGAFSGIIVYRPVRAIMHFLRIKQEVVS